MRIDVLTIFPQMFTSPFADSIVGKARQRGIVDLRLHDIRDATRDRHRVVDDAPYGGGSGMVMKIEPLVAALEAVRDEQPGSGPLVYMSPQGERLEQERLKALAREPLLTILCGHYEGVDERFVEHFVDLELSIGDYVTTGGEIPAMVLIDALVRLLPGVVGKRDSVVQDSFYGRLLDYPHYTRPQGFRGYAVPEVLLSGNHAAIERWRRKEALRKTRRRRPELLAQAPLSEEDQGLLAELEAEEAQREIPLRQ
ncbi:MAG: tRNA (guanosine(37)-N1)-methyltransferase TrmD [Candidatus Tectomicrobia bacterium]|nr:tRNA (guanosine(37)-N1)-methyltransferase TrmD [Candidatus Tectomicrobia bacterium]